MDGGYYAIKGFEFQIDKTILEILDTEDKVSLENIQDINTDSFVIQVKYKETQDYSDNKIREPVIQLIEEFEKDKSKDYKIFCYFKDKDDVVENIDIDRLNSILSPSKGKSDKAKKINQRISAFSNELKNEFLEKFCISYSKDYQEQFSQVVKKLKEDIFIGSSDDEIIFYYSNITNFLRKLVINTVDPTQRFCSKQVITNYIKDGKKLVFDSSFRDYKGEQEYFKLVKKKNFTSLNIDDFERFIILDLLGTESIPDIKDVVLHLKKAFYKKPNRGSIQSGAPYIHFINIEDNLFIQLKKQLLSEGHLLKDGHDFYRADFSLKTIKEPSTQMNGICIKFLNTAENLQQIVSEDLGKTKEIYQFFINDEIDIGDDIRHTKIKINCLSDITHII